MLATRLCLLKEVRVWVFQPRITAKHLSTTTKPFAPRISRDSAYTAQVYQDSRKFQVTSLFQSLRRSLGSVDDQTHITSRITDNLNHFIPLIHRPHKVYENVVRLLINNSCLPAATAVHERMVAEGFVASASLEAQMIVMAMALVDEKGERRFLRSLKAIIKNPLFTHNDLLVLLGTMAERDWSPGMLNAMMDEFYKTHPSNGDINFYQRMVDLETRSGNVQQALDTLSVLPESGDKSLDISRAYTSFIAAIRDVRHWDREAVTTALKVMEQQGIEPQIALFNVLISFEVRNNSLRRAFALYDALKKRPTLLPDGFTFGSLFNCLNRLYNPNRRNFRQGRRLHNHIPSPRALYRDMMEALVRCPEAPPFKLTTSLLNVTLRSFIYKRDYVGAYIVIRCFRIFRVAMNVRTYFLVLRHLMNRTTFGIRAIRKISDDTWADRFLGLPYPIPNPQFLSRLRLSNALASRVLELSSRTSFRLTSPLYITEGASQEQEVAKYHVPTVENMLGIDPVPLDHQFDTIPLERLVRKAILVASDSMRQLDQGRETSLYISQAIAIAQEEMIPPQVTKRLKKVSKSREADGIPNLLW